MDVRMPLHDGVHTTKEIRRLEEADGRPPIHIIALAASDEERQQAIAAGCDDVIMKPVSLPILEGKVVSRKEAVERAHGQ